jgi:hypothetical protein
VLAPADEPRNWIAICSALFLVSWGLRNLGLGVDNLPTQQRMIMTIIAEFLAWRLPLVKTVPRDTHGKLLACSWGSRSNPFAWPLICVVDLVIKSWLSRDRVPARHSPMLGSDGILYVSDQGQHYCGLITGLSLLLDGPDHAMLACRPHYLSHAGAS